MARNWVETWYYSYHKWVTCWSLLNCTNCYLTWSTNKFIFPSWCRKISFSCYIFLTMMIWNAGGLSRTPCFTHARSYNYIVNERSVSAHFVYKLYYRVNDEYWFVSCPHIQQYLFRLRFVSLYGISVDLYSHSLQVICILQSVANMWHRYNEGLHTQQQPSSPPHYLSSQASELTPEQSTTFMSLPARNLSPRTDK
jgi:hypothetical protein